MKATYSPGTQFHHDIRTKKERRRWRRPVKGVINEKKKRRKRIVKKNNKEKKQRTILRGAWRDRDTNDIFAHCSLIFYFLDFKFSNFVCPSVLHRLIWFFLKNSFRKKKNIRKTTQNALAPSIFIVLSIALKLGTPLLHTQAQNTLLQNF